MVAEYNDEFFFAVFQNPCYNGGCILFSTQSHSITLLFNNENEHKQKFLRFALRGWFSLIFVIRNTCYNRTETNSLPFCLDKTKLFSCLSVEVSEAACSLYQSLGLFSSSKGSHSVRRCVFSRSAGKCLSGKWFCLCPFLGCPQCMDRLGVKTLPRAITVHLILRISQELIRRDRCVLKNSLYRHPLPEAIGKGV